MAVGIIEGMLLAVVVHIFTLIIIAALLWQIHSCFDQTLRRRRRRVHRRVRRRLSPSFSDDIPHPPSPAHGTPPDPSLLKNLPSFTYSSRAEAEGQSHSPPECAICLIEFKEGEMGPVLANCDHLFHLDCIDKWLRSNKTCPLCRKDVNPLPTVNLPPPIRCPISVVIEIPEEVHCRMPVETTSGS